MVSKHTLNVLILLISAKVFLLLGSREKKNSKTGIEINRSCNPKVHNFDTLAIRVLLHFSLFSFLFSLLLPQIWVSLSLPLPPAVLSGASTALLVWVTHVGLSQLSSVGPPLLILCTVATTCFGSSSLIFTLIIPLFLRVAFVLGFSLVAEQYARKEKEKNNYFSLFFGEDMVFFFFFWHMKTWLLITALKERFWSWNVLEFFNGIFFFQV